MLIGIDGNEANIKERVGVNVWAYEVLKHLKGIRDKPLSREPQVFDSEAQAFVPRTQPRGTRGAEGGQGTREDKRYTFQIYLSRLPLADLPPESPTWKYRVIPVVPFWTRWRLPLDLYFHGFKGSDLSHRSDPSLRPDVFLSLSHYAPKWAPMPRIVSIMDLSFLKFPEAFKPLVRWQLTHWTAESVRNAAHVLTISEFTKKEIVRVYGYPEEKITVVYPGISEALKAFKGQSLRTQGLPLRNPSLRKKYGITGKYLLFIGTLQPKKNLPRLLEAFNLIKKDFPDLQLVISGKIWRQFASASRFTPSPRAQAEGLHASRLKYLGFVPDEDLHPLITGAECLVLPSLYEGFGIPVLDAMALGTPVAASNTTSIPEVLGGPSTDSRQACGVLFDPTSISDIAQGIREVLSWSSAKRQDQAERGMIRAEKFSWEESAKKVLHVIRSLE